MTKDGHESHYRERYGAWAGWPKGNPPDYDRCCESLMDRYHPGGHQCTRKAGHGPDGAYCRQHDPAARAARTAASDERYRVQLNRRIVEMSAPRLLEALRQIADGHNDPRTLARETIDSIKLRG